MTLAQRMEEARQQLYPNDALRHQNVRLRAENQKLRAALFQAAEKLALYRGTHTGEHVGGVEYTELMRRINAALSSDT